MKVKVHPFLDLHLTPQRERDSAVPLSGQQESQRPSSHSTRQNPRSLPGRHWPSESPYRKIPFENNFLNNWKTDPLPDPS